MERPTDFELSDSLTASINFEDQTVTFTIDSDEGKLSTTFPIDFIFLAHIEYFANVVTGKD